MSFVVIGENIHCTRIYKTDGKFVRPSDDGFVIKYTSNGQEKQLSIPERFVESADWASGKVKHCAVAAWQGLYGDEQGKAEARAYIEHLALLQESSDASFLDVNVDEFSTNDDERIKVVQWMTGVVQDVSSLPLSIDSSNLSILKAGLEACDIARGKPMVNSVSLERVEAISMAAEFGAVVVASAAGESDLPSTTEERLANLEKLMTMLEGVGIRGGDIYIDPLVFPVATDSNNAQSVLESVSALRKTYGDSVRITGGLSNVSFGMPNRKLINQVFTRMAVDVGLDSGIVDPLQINGKIIAELDVDSESYKLAEALLSGEDMFGMEYITAFRDGRLG
ncbi:MAG: dihydropteroate synthase [Lentisphaerae bacterium]|nr:dihydropteroate synthase [Lentisphaerota bacterium]